MATLPGSLPAHSNAPPRELAAFPVGSKFDPTRENMKKSPTAQNKADVGEPEAERSLGWPRAQPGRSCRATGLLL